MPDVRDRQQGCFPLGEWEKCLMCVSGRLSVGLIRCTGKYDHISFRIKTPYKELQHVGVKSAETFGWQ